MNNKKGVKTIVIIIIILAIMIGATFLESKMKQKDEDPNISQELLKNEYIKNIDMDYIEEDKIKFRVDYLNIDDINFDIVLDFVTEDSIENFDGVSLHGLEIVDDNDNQIYIDSEDQNIWTKNIALRAGDWEVVEKGENNLRQVMHLSSNDFPKSNKIYVKFYRIVLYNVNQGNPITVEYEGDYKIEVNVPNEVKDNKTIEYKCDTSKIIENIKLTNSALAVTLDSDGYISFKDNYTITDDKGNVYTLLDNLRIFDTENMYLDVADEQVLIFNMTSNNQCDKMTLKTPNGQTYELIKKDK